jgi:hypothetical protein
MPLRGSPVPDRPSFLLTFVNYLLHRFLLLVTWLLMSLYGVPCAPDMFSPVLTGVCGAPDRIPGVPDRVLCAPEKVCGSPDRIMTGG